MTRVAEEAAASPWQHADEPRITARQVSISASICWVIPSHWSRNRQPLPNSIFPELSRLGNYRSSWRRLHCRADSGCRESFLPASDHLSRVSWGRNLDIPSAWAKSPIESKPVSGPSLPSRRSLLSRIAPKREIAGSSRVDDQTRLNHAAASAEEWHCHRDDGCCRPKPAKPERRRFDYIRHFRYIRGHDQTGGSHALKTIVTIFIAASRSSCVEMLTPLTVVRTSR